MASPRSTFEVSLYRDEGMIAKLTAEPGMQVQVVSGGINNEQEQAFLFVVTECLRCLSSGKAIDLHFNPYDNSEDEVTIVKCQWGRTGCLRLLEEGITYKFQHATTPSEALQRNRNFTCSKALYRRLPQHRSRDTAK